MSFTGSNKKEDTRVILKKFSEVLTLNFDSK